MIASIVEYGLLGINIFFIVQSNINECRKPKSNNKTRGKILYTDDFLAYKAQNDQNIPQFKSVQSIGVAIVDPTPENTVEEQPVNPEEPERQMPPMLQE